MSEGDLVILARDKSGKFAEIDTEHYRQMGAFTTYKDHKSVKAGELPPVRPIANREYVDDLTDVSDRM